MSKGTLKFIYKGYMKFKPNEEIINFLTKYASELGVEIVDVEVKSGKNPYLTVFIDRDGGVDLDTLEKFHNLINLPLDEFDPYDSPYTLNVSSPGIDRPLKTQRDFERKMGSDVEVKLYAPLEKGVKYFEGTLVGFENGVVTVKAEKGEVISLEQSKIAKINEAVKFN